MARLPAPTTFDPEFEADGFRCALRANEPLVSLPTLRWLGLAAVLTSALGMLAVGPVSAAVGIIGLLMWPWVVIAMLYAGGKLLNALLAAPRVTRMHCTHEALSLQILVHGMLRDDVSIPLAEIEACRIGGLGLEIVRRRGGRPETIEVPSLDAVRDLEWVVRLVDEARTRRAAFEADERSAERQAARAAAERIVERTSDQPRSAR